MAWALLFAAGLFEVGWAVGLKFTDGFVTQATPLTVDAEGFIHDLATADDHVFWVAFEEVQEVIPERANE